jgi:hypothetical protein
MNETPTNEIEPKPATENLITVAELITFLQTLDQSRTIHDVDIFVQPTGGKIKAHEHAGSGGLLIMGEGL